MIAYVMPQIPFHANYTKQDDYIEYFNGRNFRGYKFSRTAMDKFKISWDFGNGGVKKSSRYKLSLMQEILNISRL